MKQSLHLDFPIPGSTHNKVQVHMLGLEVPLQQIGINKLILAFHPYWQDSKREIGQSDTSSIWLSLLFLLSLFVSSSHGLFLEDGDGNLSERELERGVWVLTERNCYGWIIF